MSQDALLILLTIFVGLVALSQLLQAIALLKLRKSAQALHQQVTAFVPQVQTVLKDAEAMLTQSRKQLLEISGKTNDLLDVTRNQMGKVELLMNDFSERARVQMDRAEMVLDDTLGRVHETVATVHNGVMRPLKEITGISAGIRAAIGQMMKGGRPSVAQATSDEEMFI
jgi:ABC-type transporter Mla subunit MlaD